VLLVSLGWLSVPIVGFMGLPLWIALIGLIVLLARRAPTTAPGPGGAGARLLEERYARGEITREEFLERRTVLDRTWPDAPR
jgi:uncharacterized membrane protein